MSQLRFDGRVVIVTGAGAGLGKAYALMFASRGASVVVNDLGGGRHGDDGKSTRAADDVVEEIKNLGGKAVADYNSVVDGENIVKTALDNFGRVDIVINNAGVLRDRSFPRISNADWDIIQDVHLKGAFKVTQAAWPHFRKQSYGRIIFTSSNAALCGNFGQANYSAAKMGLIGLNNTLAIEGKKYNIKCNTIVPTAASRLTEDILPADLFAELKPELIAPVVLWLCHEDCYESGAIIETTAGWAAKVHLVRGNGTLLRNHITETVSPEVVRDKWLQVTDMKQAYYATSIEECTFKLFTQLDDLRTGINFTEPSDGEHIFTYGYKDVILYALGIGASVYNNGDLKYLFENEMQFSVFPTFVLVPATLAVMTSSAIASAIPGKDIDFSMVLHGEQYLELYKPLPTDGTLKSVVTIGDVIVKGNNAIVLTDVDTYDQYGDKVAYSQVVAFILGAGGYNGKFFSDKEIPIEFPPSRYPDVTQLSGTLVDQAALYRLSGDTNPLHIDPLFSSLMGYEVPILHGLCTLGFAVRQVLLTYANNDPTLFKRLKVRFSKPVIPGQVLATSMWLEGSRVYFETNIADANVTVLSGGYVDLHTIAYPFSMDSGDFTLIPTSEEELLSDLVFAGMKDRIEADRGLLKKINGVFLYHITKDGKKVAAWTADLKSGDIYKGTPKGGLKVDTTLTIDDNDFADMALGKLNPQMAFIKGKLKIQGNIMLTQKLKSLMTEPKL